SRIEQSASELDAALEELGRLSSEQERAARAESQLGGYYQRLNETIRAGDLSNAAGLLGSMREFLNAPSLKGVRSLESRKQAHLAAIDSLELSVAETLRLQRATPSPSGGETGALQEQIEALEDTVSQQQATIEAFGAQGSETGRLISGYEERISGLQAQVSTQQQTLSQRDASISGLRAQVDEQAELLVEQDRRIVAFQGQAETLTGRIANNDATIAELRSQNEALTRANEDLSRQIETVRQLLQQ
ncbi:MAG: hypothetical protein LBQ67_01610, partial [Treponema sp.]|nr:hypothetical protein [Treponema sp.]